MMKNKVANMREREEFEQMILDIERCSNGSPASKKTIEKLKLKIEDLIERLPSDDSKLYLSELVIKEKIELTSNNMFLAPAGCGKTTAMEKVFIGKVQGKILMVVSTSNLRDSLAPDDNDLREQRALNGVNMMMFTTKNPNYYGDKDYTIHVMTYAELGRRIYQDDEFIKQFIQIHCDEIHSLPEYRDFNRDFGLDRALKYLFGKHEGQTIFYYTATPTNIYNLESREPGTLADIAIFDYREHAEIKKYMALTRYLINNIEQIRSHIQARVESWDYFDYKGLCFCKTIRGQKKAAQIIEEEGMKPLMIWADSNTDHIMTQEQKDARDYLIRYNKIPDEYDFLIINPAMREGWDLKDKRVKLAIMNSTNETDSTQAMGRIRNDVDVLIIRTDDKTLQDVELKINIKFINVPLTADLKKELCSELNLINSRGAVSQWKAVSQMIVKNQYDIKESSIKIDGKRTRVSTITKA